LHSALLTINNIYSENSTSESITILFLIALNTTSALPHLQLIHITTEPWAKNGGNK